MQNDDFTWGNSQNMTKMQQVRLQPSWILPFSFYSYRRKQILGIFALFLRLSFMWYSSVRVKKGPKLAKSQPQMPKMGQKWPISRPTFLKIGLICLKMLQKWPKFRPKCLKIGLIGQNQGQNASKRAKIGPKPTAKSLKWPKMAQI